MERCGQRGIKPHPARYPIQVPRFFIRYLTDPGDLVLDPFAGSNTTGQACEEEGRRWVAVERERDYLVGSQIRFEPGGEPGGKKRKPKKEDGGLFLFQ